MQIYTADTALCAEDVVFSSPFRASDRGMRNMPVDESSLAHFCAFIDFYTRKTADPMSTALACEKHAEALDITPQDATPENMHLLVDTMLEVIDHLEKKWLDEQIRHEERMQKHREDVARLSRQIQDLQPQPSKRTQMYQRGMHWFQNLFFRKKSSSGPRIVNKPPRRAANIATRKPRVAKVAV